MKCLNDAGLELDANFSVEADDDSFRIVLDSRGGAAGGPTPARNVDYARCLEVLLARAGRYGCVLSHVKVVSRPALALPEDERKVTIRDHPYPIRLETADVVALRQALGRASARFGRQVGTEGGNPTKKLRLHLTFGSLPMRTAAEIGSILSRAIEVRGRPQGPGANWTEDELKALVDGYRALWLAQRDGVEADQAAFRDPIPADALRDRSPGSYEACMQNVSALMEDLGIPIVTGVLPKRNMGRIRASLIMLIGQAWGRVGVAEAPTADPQHLETRVEAAAMKIRSGWAVVPVGSAAPVRMGGEAQRFVRDPNVIAWVLEAAAGRCESCDDPAPFLRGDGSPYLEVHHVRPLADGGPDTIDNAVAVCPNCHRDLHHGGEAAEKRRRVIQRVGRIVDHPRRAVMAVPFADLA